MRRVILAAALIVLCVPAPAGAGVVNGDFEDGGGGWVVTDAVFPGSGGNPGGYVLFGGARGSIIQEIQAQGTVDDPCYLSFDVLRMREATPKPGAPQDHDTTIGVRMDDAVVWNRDVSIMGFGWSAVTLEIPCGTHSLEI